MALGGDIDNPSVGGNQPLQNLWETVGCDIGSSTASSPTDTLNIEGGASILTSISGPVVTISNTAPNIPQNLWETIVGDNGTNPVADNLTDTLTIVGGSHVTTTGDAATDSISIAVDDDFLLNTGDVGTGVYDFGGAASFEIPNGGTPTTNTTGQIAIKTTITDHTGMIQYYDGTESLYAVGIPTTNLNTTDGHMVAYNATNNEFEMRGEKVVIMLYASATEASLVTGVTKDYIVMPFAMTITEVYATVNTAPTGSVCTFDINNGFSILSTKITIDSSEFSSKTAATPPVVSNTSIASGDRITVDVDGVGSLTPGGGGIIYIIGHIT